MCYCTECFVDHIEPRWTESGATPAGMQGTTVRAATSLMESAHDVPAPWTSR